MDSTIVYFHGFGSSPSSEKVLGLRQVFDSVEAPSIPIDFDEAFEYLTSYIQDLQIKGRPLIFVGTSLGGYWAALLSRQFKTPALIINPSCTPKQTLGRYKLSNDILDKYIDLVVDIGVPRIILLARDDDVIDFTIAEALFDGKAEIKIFETGGHRFNDVNTIAKNIVELENSGSFLP